MTVAPVWPLVHAALLAVLTNRFADVAVYDTQPITGDDPDNWITVGFVADDTAGALTFVPAQDGFSVNESGEVKLHLVARSGDEDMNVVRSKVMSMLAALQQLIAADMTLGGRLPYLTHLMVAAQIVAVENEDGIAAGVLASVQYTTVSQ